MSWNGSYGRSGRTDEGARMSRVHPEDGHVEPSLWLLLPCCTLFPLQTADVVVADGGYGYRRDAATAVGQKAQTISEDHMFREIRLTWEIRV